MKQVFVDAVYWIALIKPGDPWRESAVVARRALGQVMLVTTDEVLTEFLTALSKAGPHARRQGVKIVRAIMDDPNTRVVPQTRDSFRQGLDLYEARQDKHYSLQDCVSMNVLRSNGISEVLTNDHHFAQEGFEVLMKRDGAK